MGTEFLNTGGVEATSGVPNFGMQFEGLKGSIGAGFQSPGVLANSTTLSQAGMTMAPTIGTIAGGVGLAFVGLLGLRLMYDGAMTMVNGKPHGFLNYVPGIPKAETGSTGLV